jgi:F-type H+-transporting ATPase subunit gamma
MPTLAELKGSIDLREKSRPVLNAVELVSVNKRSRVLAEIKNEKPHHDNVVGIMNEIQERYPALLKKHPLATPHPESSNTHIILISMKNGLFCQPALNHLFDYLKENHSDESVTFTPVGPESQKLITRLRHSAPVQDEASEQIGLQELTETLTTQAKSAYLDSNAGSVRVINIQNNFEPRDVQLLPITLPDSDKTQGVLNHDGDSDAAVTTLLKNYMSTVIYDALLETEEAEHLSRMLASHRAVENIDETLPELKLSRNRKRRDKITTGMLELSQ